MRIRLLTGISAGVVLLLAIMAMVALSKLPANMQLPVHWNAAGKANGFANASFALFMPVVLTAGLSVLFAILPRIEPLQDHMRDSAPLLATCWAGLLVLMVLTEIAIAAPAFGLALPSTLYLAALGIFLTVIGNALPKSRPGFFVGIRTPWTLTDTDNWIATHRLGSRTMIAGGAIIVIVAALPIEASARAFAVCLTLVCAVVPPVIYSYLYWRWNGTHA